jgi:single-strand DNA-binding protein
MSSVNKVILVGRLGGDPELRYSQTNTAIATFSIATDESYTPKDGGAKVEKTEWHKIVIFGRQAENAEKYLRKGSLVYVEGSLQTRKWEDRDGNERWTTEVKAYKVAYLADWGSEDRESGGSRGHQGDRKGSKGGKGRGRSGTTREAEFDPNFSDDEIPF